MKITIVTTQNGWLVYRGTINYADDPNGIIPASWTFDSLDKALACLRKLMKPRLQPTPAKVNK